MTQTHSPPMTHTGEPRSPNGTARPNIHSGHLLAGSSICPLLMRERSDDLPSRISFPLTSENNGADLDYGPVFDPYMGDYHRILYIPDDEDCVMSLKHNEKLIWKCQYTDKAYILPTMEHTYAHEKAMYHGMKGLAAWSDAKLTSM